MSRILAITRGFPDRNVQLVQPSDDISFLIFLQISFSSRFYSLSWDIEQWVEFWLFHEVFLPETWTGVQRYASQRPRTYISVCPTLWRQTQTHGTVVTRGRESELKVIRKFFFKA